MFKILFLFFYRQLFRKEKEKEKQTPRTDNKKPTAIEDYYESMEPIQNYAAPKPLGSFLIIV
jgi:hypothetical protein